MSPQAPRLVVSVAGQVNAEQRGFVTYEPPTLTGYLYPSTGDSEGGTLVMFSGRNLGPPTSPLQLRFLSAAVSATTPAMYCNVTVRCACLHGRMTRCFGAEFRHAVGQPL
jgi:hypothetical protein